MQILWLNMVFQKRMTNISYLVSYKEQYKLKWYQL